MSNLGSYNPEGEGYNHKDYQASGNNSSVVPFTSGYTSLAMYGAAPQQNSTWPTMQMPMRPMPSFPAQTTHMSVAPQQAIAPHQAMPFQHGFVTQGSISMAPSGSPSTSDAPRPSQFAYVGGGSPTGGALPLQSTNDHLLPTWNGFISTTWDALLLLEAVLQGKLAHARRRPQERERSPLIQSGNVFVYEENCSGIKRWTDGSHWSPSRILGNFLVYRELFQPFPPGEKKRAKRVSDKRSDGGIKRRRSTNTGFNADAVAAAAANADEDGNISPVSPGSGSDAGHHANHPLRPFCGSLVDSYEFKPKGLIKKTISFTLKGITHHIISYYTVEDAMNNRLQTPLTSGRPDLFGPVRACLLETQPGMRTALCGFHEWYYSPVYREFAHLTQWSRKDQETYFKIVAPYVAMYLNGGSRVKLEGLVDVRGPEGPTFPATFELLGREQGVPYDPTCNIPITERFSIKPGYNPLLSLEDLQAGYSDMAPSFITGTLGFISTGGTMMSMGPAGAMPAFRMAHGDYSLPHAEYDVTHPHGNYNMPHSEYNASFPTTTAAATVPALPSLMPAGLSSSGPATHFSSSPIIPTSMAPPPVVQSPVDPTSSVESLAPAPVQAPVTTLGQSSTHPGTHVPLYGLPNEFAPQGPHRVQQHQQPAPSSYEYDTQMDIMPTSHAPAHHMSMASTSFGVTGGLDRSMSFGSQQGSGMYTTESSTQPIYSPMEEGGGEFSHGNAQGYFPPTESSPRQLPGPVALQCNNPTPATSSEGPAASTSIQASSVMTAVDMIDEVVPSDLKMDPHREQSTNSFSLSSSGYYTGM